MMAVAVQLLLTKAHTPSVPSPLVGEGQGGGCHTTRVRDSTEISFIPKALIPGLPPSPALPHKGGGSRSRAPHDFQPLRDAGENHPRNKAFRT
jgi:hypothetical protein